MQKLAKNKNKKVLKIGVIALLLLFLAYSKPVVAYTGGISVFPPLIDGPKHKTVTNFPIDTDQGNPQMIITSLNYVEAVIIETDPTIKSHLLISEYPADDDLAFSFTVPKPFQDALVQATIYFWGPDIDQLQIWHLHKKEAPVLITASKVEPRQTNSDGNILWVFSTTSFSDFFTSKLNKKINDGVPFVYLAGLLGCSLAAILFFRKT